VKALFSMSRETKALPDHPVAGFSFGPFRLEPDGTLWRDQSVIHLTPKELAALRLLVAHTGRIVPPLQLKHELWGDIHTSADSLPKCLSSLRAKLHPEHCIQTVYKRGYRFSATVNRANGRPPAALPRLAVLPFARGFAVPEHLGAALAEEAIVRLVSLEQPVAAVLARDSVFALAHQKETAQQVGEALQADLVLTGTLSAVGPHFRLRAEMIRVEDETQIWVEDLLLPQSQVNQLDAVLVQRLLLRLNVRGISISVPALERQASPKQREAWEIYLRAHHEWQILQRYSMQDALQHLQQAVMLDPGLIPARIDIAHLCTAQALFGFLPPAAAASEVRRAAIATDQDSQSTDAILPALGWVRFHFDHDLPGALQAFVQAEHLPHDLRTTHLRYLLALSRHRFPEAMALLREALLLDPFSPWLHVRLAWALHLAGQAAESLAQINHAIDLFPHHEGSIFYGSLILAYNGQTERALRVLNGLTDRLSYFDLGTAIHAYALVRAGRVGEARSILERLQWLSRERFVISSFLPAVYAALGDLDAAIAELRTSLNMRCPWFFQVLADPRLAPLHGHPDFEEMRAILPRMEACLEP
jgi:DNA-binding winged helix-turn-helix (wHTH) protein/tetratricopeptide (TPR) repeat protein